MADDNTFRSTAGFWEEARDLFPELNARIIWNRAAARENAYTLMTATPKAGAQLLSDSTIDSIAGSFSLANGRNGALSIHHAGQRHSYLFPGAPGRLLRTDLMEVKLPGPMYQALRYYTPVHEVGHLKIADYLGLNVDLAADNLFPHIARNAENKLGITIGPDKKAHTLFQEKVSDLFGVAMAERKFNLNPGSLAQVIADIRTVNYGIDPAHATTQVLDTYDSFRARLSPSDTPETIFDKSVKHVSSTWSNAPATLEDRIITPDLNSAQKRLQSTLEKYKDVTLATNSPSLIVSMQVERGMTAIERLARISADASSNELHRMKMEQIIAAVGETREAILAQNAAHKSPVEFRKETKLQGQGSARLGPTEPYNVKMSAPVETTARPVTAPLQKQSLSNIEISGLMSEAELLAAMRRVPEATVKTTPPELPQTSGRFKALSATKSAAVKGVGFAGLGGLAGNVIARAGEALASTGNPIDKAVGEGVARVGHEIEGPFGLLGGVQPKEGTIMRKVADAAIETINPLLGINRKSDKPAIKSDPKMPSPPISQ